MKDSKVQISEDTWVYVDKERSKLIVEIDLPREDKQPSAVEDIGLSKIHQMN